MEFRHDKGIPLRIEDVNVGDVFVYEGEGTGLLVAYQGSMVLSVLSFSAEKPFSVLGPKDRPPDVVLRYDPMLWIIGPRPAELRNGIPAHGAQPGRIVQTPDDAYLGFINHQDDASFVSIRSGHIRPGSINGPVAVFDKWHLDVRTPAGYQTIFSYS